jgi:hypothetical protein
MWPVNKRRKMSCVLHIQRVANVEEDADEGETKASGIGEYGQEYLKSNARGEFAL